MNTRSHNRVPFYFVLLTALLDFVLAAFTDKFPRGPDNTLLITCILGLSLAQMAICLILMMRHVSAWKILLGGVIVSLAFGLTVTTGPWAAPFNSIFMLLLTAQLFGITPVVIYRIVFIGRQVQFSLILLFGLMTMVTMVCAVVVQLNLDWLWFLTYLFFFIGCALPIPLAGFMLVGPRPASMRKYVLVMSLSLVIATIIAVSTEHIATDISLVGQISGFMSLYLLLGGIVLLHDTNLRIQTPQAKPAAPEADSIAVD